MIMNNGILQKLAHVEKIVKKNSKNTQILRD